MSKILKELIFKAGEKKDGSPIWKKAGILLETDYGKEVILLDRSFNPAGVMQDDIADSSCLINLFDPKTAEEKEAFFNKQDKASPREHCISDKASKPKYPKKKGETDDDIPL